MDAAGGSISYNIDVATAIAIGIAGTRATRRSVFIAVRPKKKVARLSSESVSVPRTMVMHDFPHVTRRRQRQSPLLLLLLLLSRRRVLLGGGLDPRFEDPQAGRRLCCWMQKTLHPRPGYRPASAAARTHCHCRLARHLLLVR